MINIRTLNKLKDNDGLTLKAGTPISYKSGWQVATEGIETKSTREAMRAIKNYCGNCGVWYSQGTYYIDKCRRTETKHEALKIGLENNQISIYGWRSGNLAYCKDTTPKLQ